MPDSSPYISKILCTTGTNIASVNIVPADNKVTIEGVMNANVVYECDEKMIHHHVSQVPFSTSLKLDGITAGFNVAASVHPMSCNIKARRGRELLVDAKIGIALNAVARSSEKICTDITVGEAKVRDDAAIVIYMVRDKETLWEVAKHLNIPSTEIVKQNPSCANALTAGDRILIYRQAVINF